jgi:hypothetical protein
MGNNTDLERQTEINITSMKVYNGQEDKQEPKKRTTSFSNLKILLQMEILTN